MGSTVGNIARTISNPAGAIGGAIGGGAGRDAGKYADFMMNPAGNVVGNQVANLLTPKDAPQAPGTPQDLSQLRAGQIAYANQFQQNLPKMQATMAQQLTAQSNNQMNNQVKQVKNMNQARGLTYSGINQGQQQQVRGADQQALGQAISGSNAGLAQAAQTLNAQAIQTGVGIQQNQQQIQNQLYQQQLAQMQGQNALVGNIIGTGMLAALA